MMKRLFLLAIILPMLFVACDKEDSKPKHQISGLWELTKSYNGYDRVWYYADEDLQELHEIEFSDDGSGQFNDYFVSGVSVRPFAWVVTDNQLRLLMGEDADEYRSYIIEDINKNELVLYRENVTSYYKRMK